MTDHDNPDAFSFALGTFSNAPPSPPVTFADIARAAYETNAYVFRHKARHWYERAGWRKWRELTKEQQELALENFRKPPPLLEPHVDFEISNYSYFAIHGRPRPTYVIAGLGAVEISGAPYGKPPYRRCAACGKAKRSAGHRSRPYCRSCAL